MTPQIALDLSLDGITVLSRAPDGGWWREGTVKLDAPDMPARMARLRDRIAARVGDDFTSLLILPDSQLLYTSLERDDRRPEETIRALLKGRTPYAVEDLTFDYIQRGDRLQVAVVALETLLEAETFAADYGFRPVALVANPKDPAYPGIPNFGQTGIASTLLDGTALEIGVEDGFSVTPAPAPPKPAPPASTEATAPTNPAAKAKSNEEQKTPPATKDTAAPAPLPVAPPEPKPEPGPEPVPSPVVDAEPTPVFTSPRRAKAPKPDRVEPRLSATPPPAAPPPTPTAAMEDTPTAASTPGFTSSRQGKGATSDARSAAGDRLARVAPRLTAAPAAPTKAPAPAPDRAPASEVTQTGPASAEPVRSEAKPRRPAALGGQTRTPVPPATSPTDEVVGADDLPPDPRQRAAAAPVLPVSDDDTTSPAQVAATARNKAAALGERAMGLAAKGAGLAAGGLGAAVARAKAARATPKVSPETEAEMAARQAEAEALALPGLARERAAAPKRSSAKLGLTMTLGLLGLLGVVAVGSVLLGPSDTTEAPAETDVAPEPDVASLPRAPAPAQDATALPEVDAPFPEQDIASLIPDSSDPAVDSTAPEVASAPVPIPSAPTPLPETDTTTATLSEDQLLPDIAPDRAEAPALDAAPSLDTSTTAFTQPLEADGLFEAPPNLGAPETSTAENITVAAIDPSVSTGEAAALPAALPPSDSLALQTNPPPAGTAFDTDATTGLVRATPEGTLAPGGYRVVLGRPAVLPVPRPGGSSASSAEAGADADAQTEAAADGPDTTAEAPSETRPLTEAEQILRRVRPVPRPADAAEQVDRFQNNGFTREELTRVRPRQRPASVTAAAEAAARAAEAEAEATAAEEAAQQAAAASLAAATDAAVTEAQAEAPTGPVSDLALPASERPRSRPRSVEREAARIVTRRREQAAAASTANTQQAATPPARSADNGRQTVRSPGGSVARAATERNVLRLNQINLIGVYGRPNARRALVRLSNGRYVKVEVGDRLDRGRVTAIGESELSYQRGGRNVVLRLPRA